MKILTVHSHGVEYFFYVLQAAVLLTKGMTRDVTVVMLPCELPLQRARNLWRSWTGKSVDTKESAEGIYGRFRRGVPTIVECGSRRVIFELAGIRAGTKLVGAGLAAAATLRIVAASFTWLRFDPLRFLHGQHRGVRVGDLAASSYLRSGLSTTTLQLHPLLVYWLWKACYLIELTRSAASIGNLSETYTMTPESSYVFSAGHRFLHAVGAAALDLEDTGAAVALVPSPGSPSVGLADKAQVSRECSPTCGDSEFEAYFHARLFDAVSVLPYLTGWNDNRATDLRDLKSCIVTLDPNGLYAVVFLHSFGDGQYYYGLDGFADLADWTFCSIDTCLTNERLTGVLIKPHPTTMYQEYRADRRVFQMILDRYGNDPRVTILNYDASVLKLSTAGRLVGVTHHGSIAEELVYLGQPVIASTVAPWGDRYHFARLWSTPEECRQLLEGLGPDTWYRPTDREKQDLRRYVSDCRICEVRISERDPAAMLARLSAAPESAPPMEQLASLRQDDAQFASLLDAFEALDLKGGFAPGFLRDDEEEVERHRATLRGRG